MRGSQVQVISSHTELQSSSLVWDGCNEFIFQGVLYRFQLTDYNVIQSLADHIFYITPQKTWASASQLADSLMNYLKSFVSQNNLFLLHVLNGKAGCGRQNSIHVIMVLGVPQDVAFAALSV